MKAWRRLSFCPMLWLIVWLLVSLGFNSGNNSHGGSSSSATGMLAARAADSASSTARNLVEAGEFKEIYDPAKASQEPWCINDHTFVHGADGLWHVFGITHIVPFHFGRDPGTNLLHATARSLTQSPWHKEPFAVTSDWARHREWLLWAPHVVQSEGLYHMFVCAGNNSGHRYRIHLLTSTNLWNWDRAPENPLLEDGFDARDPNVLRLRQPISPSPSPGSGSRSGSGSTSEAEWVMYYTANTTPEGGHHQVVSVRSKDLRRWDQRRVVFTHDREGTFAGPTESPFVVRRGSTYYLFVCDGGIIAVYGSQDPLHWEMNQRAGTIQAHASEVVRDLDGAWYISHAGWEHGGLYLAPLIWHDGLDAADASLAPGQ